MFRNKHHRGNKKIIILITLILAFFYDETLKQNTCVYKGLHKKKWPIIIFSIRVHTRKNKTNKTDFLENKNKNHNFKVNFFNVILREVLKYIYIYCRNFMIRVLVWNLIITIYFTICLNMYAFYSQMFMRY